MKERKMNTLMLAVTTPFLNRLFGTISAFSGAGMIVIAPFIHDLATGLSGVGALSVALVMFQLSDVRERLQRLEMVLLESATEKSKHHHA